MKKNIITLAITLIIILSLVELSIRIYLPQDLSSSFRMYGNNGLLLNKKNSKATHYYKERKIKYTFGKFHERSYDLLKKEKKVLILGDSFTFGWLVSDKNTFVYKLDKNFDQYTFVNASAGGWGTSDQLRYLIDFCERIKPLYIINIINFLDFERVKNSNLFYLDKNDNLTIGSNPISKMKKVSENSFYKFLIENYHTLNYLKKKYLEIFIHNKSTKNNNNDQIKVKDSKTQIKLINKNKNYNLIKKVYKKMKLETEKCGSNLFVINLSWEDFKNYDALNFLKFNYSFFKNNEINFIELYDEMKFIRDNKSDYVIAGEGHPNEKANEFIYEILKDEIENIIK